LRWVVSSADQNENGNGPIVAPGGFRPVFDAPLGTTTLDACGRRPVIVAGQDDIRGAVARFEAPFVSVNPTKEAAAQEGGVDLGEHWDGNNSSHDVGFYFEVPNLIVPSIFTNNHVIFETGGNGTGAAVVIYRHASDDVYYVRAVTGGPNHALVEVDVRGFRASWGMWAVWAGRSSITDRIRGRRVFSGTDS